MAARASSTRILGCTFIVKPFGKVLHFREIFEWQAVGPHCFTMAQWVPKASKGFQWRERGSKASRKPRDLPNLSGRFKRLRQFSRSIGSERLERISKGVGGFQMFLEFSVGFNEFKTSKLRVSNGIKSKPRKGFVLKGMGSFENHAGRSDSKGCTICSWFWNMSQKEVNDDEDF